MNIIKLLLLSAFIIVYLPAFAQTTDPVFLKWKIKPGQSLKYKTIIASDTAIHINWGANGIFKPMGVDSANAGKMQEILKELGAAHPDNFVTTLTETHKGLIDVIGIAKPEAPKKSANKPSDDKAATFQELSRQLTGGVMLRGVLNEDGSVASFYTANDERNLLAMLFELPKKTVKEGDSWPLDVHLVSVPLTFACDSAFKKNEVKVLKVENKNNEHLVTLKYDIEEYVSGGFSVPHMAENVKTTVAFSYQGLSVFSVEKGKWVSYNGIITNESTGFMVSKSKTRYALIEE
jgi:hypothetical protein